MATREQVEELWPELTWIKDQGLREQTLSTWMLAFERSPLEPSDLLEIPFTLHVPGCTFSFIAHKPPVLPLATVSAAIIADFMADPLPVDEDTLLPGAILPHVG